MPGKRSLYVFLALLFSCQIFSQNTDQVLFTGRFDFSQQDPSFSHVGSSLSANFSGTGISAVFSAVYGTSYLYAIIDGHDDPGDRTVLEVRNSEPESFILAEDLDSGSHQVEIVKLNPYDTKLVFHGFELRGGSLQEVLDRPPLSLEFYGDSSPEGHSAWDAKDWGRASDNGAYFSYPGITARLLGAQYHNISMGGAGVTSATWNLRDYHHLIHMNEAASGSNLWDFSSYTPDVVVVNLGANDYYSNATKALIKKGWKDFVRENLRAYYPQAHIVLVNAYGWAIKEPADYVHEAVEELHAEGENNVSSVVLPWLWGQEHAVVNEHAGFANILAKHIAEQLGLPQPDSSELSSFAPHGQVSNGSFEKSILEGVADGWRPHGPVSLVSDSSMALDGENYLELGYGAWVNFANEANPGEHYELEGWLRGVSEGASGALKLEFKDQAQNTIIAAEDRRSLSDDWEYFTVSLNTPRTVWSVWVVLESGQGNLVDFDRISMRLNGEPSALENLNQEEPFFIYPNPSNGEELNIINPGLEEELIFVHDQMGRMRYTGEFRGEGKQKIRFREPLDPGIYSISITHAEHTYVYKFIVH